MRPLSGLHLDNPLQRYVCTNGSQNILVRQADTITAIEALEWQEKGWLVVTLEYS